MCVCVRACMRVSVYELRVYVFVVVIVHSSFQLQRISAEKPRYYINSATHRAKLRLMQCLIVASTRIDEVCTYIHMYVYMYLILCTVLSLSATNLSHCKFIFYIVCVCVFHKLDHCASFTHTSHSITFCPSSPLLRLELAGSLSSYCWPCSTTTSCLSAI